MSTAWSQSFATKDVNKITASYSDDASVYMHEDVPVINGIAAIKAAMTPMVADKNFTLTFASTGMEVAKSGDIAYSHGTFTQTSTDPKTKKVVTVNGKYLTVFEKTSRRRVEGNSGLLQRRWRTEAGFRRRRKLSSAN